MGKINRRLLPIKAHYLFFMGAMGPILPQLPVLGKQIGISPQVMGYITSVLPIMYVIIKPLFGFVADYFSHFRKTIFVMLIAAMTLSYAAFYFVPNAQYPGDFKETWNLTGNPSNISRCPESLVTVQGSTCTSAVVAANCSNEFQNFTIYITSESPSYFQVPEFTTNANICASSDGTLLALDNASINSSSCSVNAQQQTDCLYNSLTFWLFVFLMCTGTIGFNVVNSISDAICFDVLGESEERKYGVQRVWGTIGFGLTAILAGIAVNLWTEEVVKSFTPALVIMFIFSCFDLLSVFKLRLPKLSSSESVIKDVWGLISQPAIAVFMVFATIAGIIDSFIIYFLFWHLEDVAAATGYMGSIKLIEGCVVAAECLGEIPFFFYSGSIIKKLGYVHCMSMCFFFYALRLMLISWIPNPWYLVGVELFFQGCTYALCYTCIVAYASALAPPGTSATIQGLMAGMDDGLGFSIGSFISGLALKHFGGRRSFRYFSMFAIATCVLHILIRPSHRKQGQEYLPKNEYQTPPEQEMIDMSKT